MTNVITKLTILDLGAVIRIHLNNGRDSFGQYKREEDAHAYECTSFKDIKTYITETLGGKTGFADEITVTNANKL